MTTTTEFTFATAPGALPILGHAPHLMRDPLGFLASLPAHGDLVAIRLGPQHAYVPCHPELLRQLLADDRTYDKGGLFYDRLRDMFGDGLATCPQAHHRRQRRALQPAFRTASLRNYIGGMEKETDALISPWHDGHTFEAFPSFRHLSMRTVMRTLFGTLCTDARATAVQAAVNPLLAGLVPRTVLPEIVTRLPLPSNLRYTKALDELPAVVDRLVEDFRHARPEEATLMSLMLDARDEDGRPLSARELRDQVVTLLVSGTETTASALTWAFLLLAENPQVRDQLEEEVDRSLGDGPAHLAQLPIVRRVLLETLRMRPSAWLFTRVTRTRVTLAGHVLESGATLFLSPHPIQSRPDLFDWPERFAPDRWVPEHGAALPHSSSFVSFGHGARKCIGDEYSLLESALALAAVSARWRLEVEPGSDTRPVSTATPLRPRSLRLRVTARHGASA
ncbi:cytochrome P450 [Streptomyces alanosinicus]|uniref:Cytochrome P450 n=1 Tax=Streptomyces alanosinicus TaxID=68171 RepID=A0A918YR55_9ACTN|nr:cytochrome P450 [Streptomyces alanosinicus]GHE12924.1 cytochrome P450 [Streptomyces alanosinicus]